MSEIGAVFYRGPSLLTGDAILGVLTGLEGGSTNPKTGPMAQAYILRADVTPMDAKRRNVDDAVCGDCKLRGRDGVNSGCYVSVWNAPRIVWEQATAGRYLDAAWADMHALLEGRSVRLGAYGDPAAIPYEVWQQLLTTAGGWVAYTHQWLTCDQRFRDIAMASVDTEREFFQAGLRGWRTFRVRKSTEPIIAGAEFICPASDETGHRTTCQRCQLCRGTSSPARSVVIDVHGKPSNLKAFGIDVRGMFGRPRMFHVEQSA
jgi:hypothetical protein